MNDILDIKPEEKCHLEQHNNGWKYVCDYESCDWWGIAFSTWLIHEERHHE